MTSLPFGLTPGDRETPLDYVSRLACRNHRGSVRLFCSDFGLAWSAVAAGDGQALATVAELGRSYETVLAAEATRPLPRRRLLYRGHEFPAASLSRQQVRLCPACALADVAGGSGRVEARPWRRGEWLLRDVHACPVHGIALLDLGAQHDPKVPDFSRALSSARGPTALVHLAVPLVPTPMEMYILGRIGAAPAGDAASPLVDSLPLHACIRLSEVVGAVAMDGPGASMTNVPGPILRQRQRHGFDIVQGGVRSLRDFLEHLLSAKGRRGGDLGPQALFGRLYLWLAHPALDPSFAPIRDIVREFCLDRLAIGPGDAVRPFGHKVSKRLLHSIRSASVEFAIHPATLRNLLVAEGVVAPGSALRCDDLTTFDARQHSAWLAEFAEALDLAAAAGRLGVSTGLLKKFVRDGIVIPFLGGAGSGFRHYRFRQADLDAFVDEFASERPTFDNCSLLPVLPAARAVGCSVSHILQLLRDRRLLRVVREDGTGLGAVLVDPDEIRACRSPSRTDLVHPAEVREQTGLPLHVVRALVRHGALRGARHVNPATGVLRLLIEKKDFQRFRAEHVSLAELARGRNVSPNLLSSRLTREGVVPMMDQRLVGAILYRRVDLPDLAQLSLVAWPAEVRRPQLHKPG